MAVFKRQAFSTIGQDASQNSHSAAPGLLSLMLVHMFLLGWGALRYAPTQDEMAHLPAGLVIWQRGDFSLYRVNPPLVRLVASLPLNVLSHEEDWTGYEMDSDLRLEWGLGRRFIRANGERSLWLFTVARWCCLPFSLLGMWVCYHWGTELTSMQGGRLAATLWCFSPNVIGHGALITPDIAATATGLLAAWRFSTWLSERSLKNLLCAGLSLGLALLTKSYWITLLVAWPGLAVVYWFRQCPAQTPRITRENKNRQEPNTLELKIAPAFKNTLGSLTLIMLLGLNVLNLGYLFSGTGTQLKSFNFYSSALSGALRIPGENLPGNRFENSWLGELPVPFPKDYVTGIDLQKVDFEQGKWSYFLGEVKDPGGWLAYYAVGLFLKVPIGTWALLGLSGLVLIHHPQKRRILLSLLPLLLPVLVLFVLASLQTGMNRHVRYVFPLLPLIYLLCSIAAEKWSKLSWLLVTVSIISSLVVYPHSLSYFNFLIGGPNRGEKYLIDSNLDWGQDMRDVREWIEAHTEARPVWIEWVGEVPLECFGITANLIPNQELPPGWYLISRHQKWHPRHRQKLERFDRMTPVDRIGYTFDVYHIE